MNGDLHERIFLEDLDEREIGFFISIFQDVEEISDGLMVMDTKKESDPLHKRLIYMISRAKSTPVPALQDLFFLHLGFLPSPEACPQQQGTKGK
jgi:hypothetical protein